VTGRNGTGAQSSGRLGTDAKLLLITTRAWWASAGQLNSQSLKVLITNPLNSSALAFPVLECFHIVGFAFSIGTIAIVDFSLLGIGLRGQSPAQLTRDTWLWTLGGLVVMLFSGLLLFSSDPDMYYLNWAFLIKMVFFISAVTFHYTIHRKAVSSDVPPANGRLVAWVSLVLWTGVIFGGIFIGFIYPGLGIG
jgi:hypothetical protein